MKEPLSSNPLSIWTVQHVKLHPHAATDEIERLTAELGVAKMLGEKWAPVLNERDDALAERDRLRAALRQAPCPRWHGPYEPSDDGTAGGCIDNKHCTCEFGPAIRGSRGGEATVRHFLELAFIVIVVACLLSGAVCAQFVDDYDWPHCCVTDLPEGR